MRLLAWVCTAIGVAHFVRPNSFTDINAAMFPHNPRRHVFINGALETGLGLSLLRPRWRNVSAVGYAVYATYLLANLHRARRDAR